MTNDLFGHTAGDELIKKSSEILQQVCRQNDVVARVGGDEFIVLLPNTTKENAEKILARIKSGSADARVEAIHPKPKSANLSEQLISMTLGN